MSSVDWRQFVIAGGSTVGGKTAAMDEWRRAQESAGRKVHTLHKGGTMAGDGKERPANVAANGAETIIAEVRALRAMQVFSSATNRAFTRIEDTAQKIYDSNAPQNASGGKREKKPRKPDTGLKPRRK